MNDWKQNEHILQSAVIFVAGPDRIGLVAEISSLLANAQVNIGKISLSTLQGFCTMVIVVDISEITIDILELDQRLKQLGERLLLSIDLQRLHKS